MAQKWGRYSLAMKKAYARERKIVVTSLIGIGANLLLAGFKALVGLLANSIAIVLDALNNLSDALSSVITIIGMALAGKPANRKHPYGYGRVEYISSVIIAGIVLSAGITSLVESIKKIIRPEVPNYSALTLVIVSVAIVAKLLLGYYTKKVGKQTNSGSLVASGADATFDAFISSTTLAGAIANMIWGITVEGYLGAIISAVIIKAGFDILLDTLDEILGRRADSELTRSIKTDINEHEGVLGAYDLVLHNYGPENMIGSVHIEVYDYLTARDIYRLSKEIQTDIFDKYGIFLTTGIYAVNTTDDETGVMAKDITKAVLSHEYILEIHALYIDHDKKLITFDIVIDFEAEEDTRIRDEIIEELNEEYPEYTIYTVNIDKDYSD